MNQLKNILVLMIIMVFAASCEKEYDNLEKVNSASAPSNVTAIFDITQDNTGLVTIQPNADGATKFHVTFGDTINEIPKEYDLQEVISHYYTEGVFKVVIKAIGLSGKSSSYEKDLTVTFRPPVINDVNIEFDGDNPNKIYVSADIDYAMVMDVYFGDVENEEPLVVLTDSIVSHVYATAGDYIVKIEARSGGEATNIYTETVNIAEPTEPVTLPINFESYDVNYAFTDFDGAVSSVVENPDVSGLNTSVRVGKSIKPADAGTGAGTYLTLENPIDFSMNKLFKVKVWSPKSGAVVKLKVENLDDDQIFHEVDALTSSTNEWEELSWDFSGIDITNEYQKVVFFFDYGNAGDGTIYYFDDVVLTSASGGGGITGTWKMAPEAGSLGVGPGQGDISWWAIDDAGVLERDCFFDDTYVFNADGSFSNVLGAETWVEDWQGGSNACGTPIAPHDGSAAATYTYDEGAGSVTVNGIGAYLGIPKAYNGGELTTPEDAPESITYVIELSENDTRMTLDIEIDGGWWRFILVKEGGSVSSPLDGTWTMAPEAGSLGVGPGQGDLSWWAIDDAGVAERGCFYDDTYVFGSDGSFSNGLGIDTWLEDWQIGSFECGTPVAPHDGTVTAAYSYNAGAGTVTINGLGAYLGIPKVYNGGELTTPDDAPESITYLIELSENDTRMTLDIEIADGGWWRFIMIKN